MRDPFYDGVFIDAQRTNEASGRSWHIPEREPSHFGLAVAVIGAIIVGLSLIGVVLS